MKAMILAAGLGTRLGETTKTIPKCLVEAGGKTMLERVVERLKAAGVSEFVINLHHLADSVREFVKRRDCFGVSIEFSYEDDLLDTGGAVRKALTLLGDEDFFLHNSDVYCDADLAAFADWHRSRGALASLCVMQRESSRLLLFDEAGRLCGWENPLKSQSDTVPERAPCARLAFSGIQLISPRIVDYMLDEAPAFSIIRSYMRAARAGEDVAAYRIDDSYWLDMGSPDKLAELRRKLEPGA